MGDVRNIVLAPSGGCGAGTLRGDEETGCGGSGQARLPSGQARTAANRNVAVLCHRGFTLVELMVVIVIIGLLAAAVSMGVRSYLVKGKQNVAKMEIANICQALDTYYAAHDAYPSNEEGIEILTRPSSQFVDGLLTKMPRDPWGNAYQYNQPGRTRPYEVICFGADAREGGTGADMDISSDSLEEKND
jgi:general secretion pathway protein G